MADLPYVQRMRELEAENVRLREKLIQDRTDLLWNAYHAGHEELGMWDHMCMSDGQWLVGECGFPPSQRTYAAAAIKAAIPKAAARVLEEASNV